MAMILALACSICHDLQEMPDYDTYDPDKRERQEVASHAQCSRSPSRSLLLKAKPGEASRRASSGRLLAQDLLDARDRLVDRLLGADALGHDAVDRLAPRRSPARPGRAAIRQSRSVVVSVRPGQELHGRAPSGAGRSGRARTAARAAPASAAGCGRRRSRASAPASPRRPGSARTPSRSPRCRRP